MSKRVSQPPPDNLIKPPPPPAPPPLHDEEETMGDKKQENELVRLIQILEGAGYRVLKAEIIQEPVRHGLIDITIRDSSAAYISAI